MLLRLVLYLSCNDARCQPHLTALKSTQITVSALTGATFDYQASSFHTVLYIKNLIFQQLGVEQCAQRLYLGQVRIDEDDSLMVSDFNFFDGATLHVIPKLADCG